jgi:hypothetical protein
MLVNFAKMLVKFEGRRAISSPLFLPDRGYLVQSATRHSELVLDRKNVISRWLTSRE